MISDRGARIICDKGGGSRSSDSSGRRSQIWELGFLQVISMQYFCSAQPLNHVIPISTVN